MPLRSLRDFTQVVSSASYRFYIDDCFSRASALAYTSLFALVPLTIFSVQMLGLFRLGEEQVGATLQTLIENYLPRIESADAINIQSEILTHLNRFLGNVAALNAVSIAVFVFTGIALFNTIESALNVIWRVASDRSIMTKVISYWAVITLPLPLIVISIYWTTSTSFWSSVGAEVSSSVQQLFNVIAPIVFTWLGLTLLLFKLPSARVRLRDAAVGALISAVLFELSKVAFAYYVTRSASYAKIYGVLATIPLFLLWIYVFWVIVLFGAEITYQGGMLKIQRSLRKYATELGEVGGVLGLRVLFCIGKNFIEGKPPPDESELSFETGANPVLIRSCLNTLTTAEILSVVDPDTQTRALLRSPETLRIKDLLETFVHEKHRVRTKDEVEQSNGKSDCGTWFLDQIRLCSQNLGPERSAGEWSLREFIEMADSSAPRPAS